MTNREKQTGSAKPSQEQIAKLLSLTYMQVMSVYSGKLGCCCGCNGKHTYNTYHMDAAGVNRGYAVSIDECNDRTVKTVLARVQSNASLMTAEDVDHDFFSFTDYSASERGRLYIVYLLPSKEETEATRARQAERKAKESAVDSSFVELAAR